MVSTKWFRHASSEFCTRFDDYKGKPITYVEIGVFAGASAHWVCENVLTHPDSKGTGIDPYNAIGRRSQENMDAVKEEARNHLAGFKNWSWIHSDSKSALRTWTDPIDVLYIDGLHESTMAMQDFVLAWPHLKNGSTVIFDDYGIGRRKRIQCVPWAVASILVSFAPVLEILPNNDKQYAVRIKDNTWEGFRRASARRGRNNSFPLEVIEKIEKGEY